MYINIFGTLQLDNVSIASKKWETLLAAEIDDEATETDRWPSGLGSVSLTL